MRTKMRLKSGLALLLTLAMLFSVMTPMMSFTATALTVDMANIGSNTKLTSKTDYAVAPGITESHIITHNKDGSNQVQAYALEIDLSNPNVGLIASYKNYMNDLSASPEWGMQTVRDQAVAAENYYKAKGETHFEVVGGMNCDFFNMQTGEPTGSLVMNGEVYKKNNKTTYFAILEDGTPVIGSGKIPANAKEVVGGGHMLIKDGIIDPNIKLNPDVFPRSSIGITADGRVILVTADGRQAPSSCGQTLAENAQQMLALGCVAAIQVDGGGSASIASQREGEASLSVRNSPSDGVERIVSSSLLVYTNATPDGEFDHANLAPVNKLYTPGSTVEFTATAVDGAGAAAQLPENGFFALADETAGKIDAATGVFTAADGFIGEVVVNYMVGENAKGTTTIEIVVPDELYVASTEQAVGPGATTDFGIVAKYKDREVTMKAGDIDWDIASKAYLEDANKLYAYFYKEGFDSKYLKHNTYGTYTPEGGKKTHKYQATQVTDAYRADDYVVVELLAVNPTKGSKYTIDYCISSRLDGYLENGILSHYEKYKYVPVDGNPGTFDGLTFTGAEEGAFNTSVFAKLLCNPELELELSVFVGSKQVSFYDFEYVTGEENKDAENYIPSFTLPTYSATWLTNNASSNNAVSAELHKQGVPLYMWPNAGVGDTDNTSAKAEIVSAADGEPVRFGDKSLRIQFDYSRYNFQKNANFYLRTTEPLYRFEGSPTAVGCWVYAPEGTTAYRLYLQVAGKVNVVEGSSVTSYQDVTTAVSMGNEPGSKEGITWTGWKYLEFDLTGTKGFTGTSNVGGAYEPYGMYQSNGVFWISYQPSNMGTTVTADTIYIDDITLIYGCNTDDTHNPEVTYIGDLSDRIVDGETVYTSNTNTFKAQFSDFEDKYMTGINDEATKMYIDGVDVTDKCHMTEGSGEIYYYDAVLPDGEHVIEIKVADNFGNETSEMRYFTIDSGSEDTEVSFVAANTPVLGEEYVLDIVTNNAENIASADIEIKVLSNFTRYWRDVTVEPAPGFKLDGEAVYNAIRDTLTFKVVKDEVAAVAEDGDKIASIITNVPADTAENLEVTHRISKGAITYVSGETNAVAVFSGKVVSTTEAPLTISVDTMLVGSTGGNIYVTDKDGNPVEDANVYDYISLGKTSTAGELVTTADVSAGSYLYTAYSTGYILKDAEISVNGVVLGTTDAEGKLLTTEEIPAGSTILSKDAAGVVVEKGFVYADYYLGTTDSEGKIFTDEFVGSVRSFALTARKMIPVTPAEPEIPTEPETTTEAEIVTDEETTVAEITTEAEVTSEETSEEASSEAETTTEAEVTSEEATSEEETTTEPEVPEEPEVVYNILRSFTFKSQSYLSKGDDSGLPTYIKLNATETPWNSQSVSWMSNPLKTADKAIVCYAEKAVYEANGEETEFATFEGVSYLSELNAASSTDISLNYAVRFNSVDFSGLKENTEYVFMVGDGTTYSEIKTFKTDKANKSTEFFVIADIQTTTVNEIANVNAALGATGTDFTFGIHTGDIVDNAGDYANWEAAGKAFTTGVLGNTDIFHTLGNHEYTGDYYAVNATHYYDLPGSKDTAPEAYSTEYGNVYIASMGFLNNLELYKSVLEWIKEDAAQSDATWKILVVHQPPYYTNPGGATMGYRELVTEVADEIGLDFVFSGHDHAYARTQPITAGKPDAEGGTVYIVSGSVGGKGYDAVNEPAHYYETLVDYKDYDAVYTTVSTTDTEFVLNAYNCVKLEIAVNELLPDDVIVKEITEKQEVEDEVEVEPESGSDVTTETIEVVTGYEVVRSISIDTYTRTKTVDCTANGHNWIVNNGWLECTVCNYAKEFDGYTGLISDKETGRLMSLVDGVPETEKWIEVENELYYLGVMGIAVAGNDQIVGEYTYNFDEDGKLLGYAILEDGDLVSSKWIEYNGGIAYLDESGVAAVGEVEIDGYTYTFDENGNLAGYAILKDGDLVRSIWIDYDGGVAYLDESGVAATGTRKIGEYTYEFDENAKLTRFAFVLENGTLKTNAWQGERYLGEDGLAVTGQYAVKEVVRLDIRDNAPTKELTLKYTFDENGNLIKGAFNVNGNYTFYYLAGIPQRGWHNVDGYWYYCDRQNGGGIASLKYDGKTSVDTVKDGKYPVEASDGTSLLFTFDNEGRLVKGALSETDLGIVYYWANNERFTGWHYIEGAVYYFSTADFYAATGETTIGEKTYTFGADGKLQMTDDSIRTEDGNYYYYDVNGKIVNGHIKDHAYTEKVLKAKDPTCTKTGLTAGEKCAVCGFVLVAQEKIAANGHTEAVLEAVAPACTETGLTEGSVCTVCDEVLVAQEVIDATGHDYVSVKTDATCTENGSIVYTCSVCDDSYTEELEATGHTEGEWEVVIPADIGVEGLEQVKCTVCDEVLDSKVIPAMEEITDEEESVTDEPSSEEPETDEPTSEEPETDEPTSDEPTSEEPETDEPTSEEPGSEEIIELVLGDMDGDGEYTAADARTILRISAGLDEATDEMLIIADTDRNGIITAYDARKVLRLAAGLDTSL